MTTHTPTTQVIPCYHGTTAEAWLQQHAHTLPFMTDDAQQQATQQQVKALLKEVKQRGDNALYEYAQRFGDALQPNEPIAISAQTIAEAVARVAPQTQALLQEAAHNITQFAQHVMQHLPIEANYTHNEGYRAGFALRPVESVACYVPAGRYPLVSSALMTTLTAKAAGVGRVVMLCANPADEILYVAHLVGVDAVYKIGGAQALGAVAFGTEQVPATHMVVGPGNRYVNEAKRQLIGSIGIDALAGPSEVAVLADATANPQWIASDLIAQAEHDPDARSYLVTPSIELAEAVQVALKEQLALLNLPSFVEESSLKHSAILVLPTADACMDAANLLASEHLHLHGSSFIERQAELRHYGTLFVGDANTVAFGDYMAGPNHTLPTGRASRFSHALSPLSFLRLQNTLTVLEPNAYLSQYTQPLAQLEQLTAHTYSAQIRRL